MLLQAQQDGLSEQAHGDVVIQPAPGADFVFVQSDVGLGVLYCEFFAGRSVDRLSDCFLAISDVRLLAQSTSRASQLRELAKSSQSHRTSIRIS